MTDTTTWSITDVMHARDIQRAVEQGRHQAFSEVQTMLADLIATAEDSYQVNRGTEVGLVAWGQRIALLGASVGVATLTRTAQNRIAWLAVQQGRTA